MGGIETDVFGMQFIELKPEIFKPPAEDLIGFAGFFKRLRPDVGQPADTGVPIEIGDRDLVGIGGDVP